MTAKLLQFKAPAALQKRLQSYVEKNLKERRKADPVYGKLWEQELGARPEILSRVNFWRLRVLHRQFEGNFTPGLPTAVKTARFVVQRVPGLKRWLPQ